MGIRMAREGGNLEITRWWGRGKATEREREGYEAGDGPESDLSALGVGEGTVGFPNRAVAAAQPATSRTATPAQRIRRLPLEQVAGVPSMPTFPQWPAVRRVLRGIPLIPAMRIRMTSRLGKLQLVAKAHRSARLDAVSRERRRPGSGLDQRKQRMGCDSRSHKGDPDPGEAPWPGCGARVRCPADAPGNRTIWAAR